MYGVSASNSAAHVSTRLYDGATPSALRCARTAIIGEPVRVVMVVGGVVVDCVWVVSEEVMVLLVV